MIEVHVTSLEDGQKIEKFVKKTLNEAPLGFIYKAFRKKDIKVNGHWVKKDHIIHTGDVVRIYVTEQQLDDFKKPREVMKQPLPYDIVYEDENILMVNKPAGELVQGDANNKNNNLVQKVLDHLYYTGEYDPNVNAFVPAPAHRLDRNTSGIVVFGKNDAALKQLEELFKDRNDIDKRYLTLVAGYTDDNGEINQPLIKDSRSGMVRVCSRKEGGKTALTRYETIERYQDTSLIECELITGRTHQIRVHLASIGNPIIGDPKYGNFDLNKEFKKKYGLNHQFLHAYKFSFGKIDGELSYLSGKTFKAPLTKELKTILDDLNN